MQRSVKGKSMWSRLAVLALGILATAACGTGLRAAEPSKSKHHGCLQTLTTKLGLSEQQQAAIHKLHTDYRKNASPIKEQLRSLHREQRQAMKQVLTEEQRTKLSGIMKAAADKKWQGIAAKLGLSDEQKERFQKTRSEFAQKFQALAGTKGENMHQQFHALRKEKRQALRRILTPEQSAKMRALVSVNKKEWRNSEHRQAFWKTVGEQLGVTPRQTEQFQKVRADFAVRMEKPAGQLKQMREETRTAFQKVLTEEQRSKLQEMRQSRKETKPASPAQD